MQHDTLISIARPNEKTICALHSIAHFLPKIPTFLHKRGTPAGRHIPRARRIGLSVQQGGIPVKKDRFRRLAAMALAAATLWAVSIYLRSRNRCYWTAAVPAAFLSLVVLQYLFSSPEMCGFSYEASLVTSVLLVAVLGVLCLFRGSGLEKAEEPNL